jgi:elongation factor Ts
MAITAALVKELRERTGAGMMDCKKALVETDGDIELAIENMRKNGQAKAAKKAGNIAAEGTIIIKEGEGVAALVEVNCQTDFVAKDSNFLAFANKVADAAIASTVTVEELQAQFEDDRVALVAKIGENINVRRLVYIQGNALASYRHGDRIGVVVAGEASDEETLKHVAMHVAASKPEFVNPEDVPAEVVEKEKAIQIDIAMNEGKPAEIAEKMVVGRMKKFTGEISLTGQAFIMEPKKSVGDILKEKGASVSTFVRLEVGEGIEKKEEDFAAEVAAQMAAAKNA